MYYIHVIFAVLGCHLETLNNHLFATAIPGFSIGAGADVTLDEGVRPETQTTAMPRICIWPWLDLMRWNHVPLLSEALQEDQYRGVQKIGIWEEHAIPMIVLRCLGLPTGVCVCITPVQGHFN